MRTTSADIGIFCILMRPIPISTQKFWLYVMPITAPTYIYHMCVCTNENQQRKTRRKYSVLHTCICQETTSKDIFTQYNFLLEIWMNDLIYTDCCWLWRQKIILWQKINDGHIHNVTILFHSLLRPHESCERTLWKNGLNMWAFFPWNFTLRDTIYTGSFINGFMIQFSFIWMFCMWKNPFSLSSQRLTF